MIFASREKVEKVTRSATLTRAQLDPSRKPTKNNFENRLINKDRRARTDRQTDGRNGLHMARFHKALRLCLRELAYFHYEFPLSIKANLCNSSVTAHGG